MRKLLVFLLVLAAPAAYGAVGTIVALNDAVTVSGLGDVGAAGFLLTGTCTTGQVTFEGSVDATTYTAMNVFPPNSSTPATVTTTAGTWTASVGGFKAIRMRISDACDANNFIGTINITQGSSAVAGAAGGGGDGAIQDGAAPAIEASVLNYTNSHPVAVRLTDTNGDFASASGGTQYTEDAVAPADPVGTAQALVRDDSRAGSVTSTNGDIIAWRGNNFGDAYVADTILNTTTAARLAEATFTGRFPAAGAMADNTTNPTVTGIAGFNLVFDGATWDRWTGAVDSELPTAAALADNTANPTVPGVASFNMCWDGANWDRCAGSSADTELPPAAALADNTANPTVPGVAAFMMCFDGATWDRCADTPLPAGDNDIGNVDLEFAGTAAATSNGTVNAQTQRVTLASDSTGQVALAAGSALVGQVSPVATATTTNAGVLSATQSAASTNSTSVKGSAGNLYSIHAINTTATLYYLRLYNSASAPTCSSATGFVATYPVPASTSGGGFTLDVPVGIGFATGIGFCITGGGSSTDNTNAATGVYVNLVYK